MLLAEGSVPDFVAASPFEAFAAQRAAPPTTTPQEDFHAPQPQPLQVKGQGEEEADDDDEGDDIVLVPAFAGLSLRMA